MHEGITVKMTMLFSSPPSSVSHLSFKPPRLPLKTLNPIIKPLNCSLKRCNSPDAPEGGEGAAVVKTNSNPIMLTRRFCSCGRRHFNGGAAAATTALFFAKPRPSNASESESDYLATLESVHPPRPDWYEEFYAWVSNFGMKAYEAEVEVYKSRLFDNLKGKAKKVVEMGIGTGPNLKYYATDADVQVFGVDPNRKMEKYAREAAVAAGLPTANFKFLYAVGEAIPLSDASVDAVVGTLVLCSVKDVDLALQEVRRVLKPGGLFLFVEHVAAKDGTVLRFIQNVFDPLQQKVSDGCHLTRETGMNILEAGFSNVDLSMVMLPNASLFGPHAYGIAVK